LTLNCPLIASWGRSIREGSPGYFQAKVDLSNPSSEEKCRQILMTQNGLPKRATGAGSTATMPMCITSGCSRRLKPKVETMSNSNDALDTFCDQPYRKKRYVGR
jgi:hypothetical protein